MARGPHTRKEVHNGNTDVAFNTYANFEAGTSWPRAATLRQIEHMLGWKAGAIDEALASGMEPGMIHLQHMRGEAMFVERPASLGDFTDEELANEVMRRMNRQQQGGNDHPGDLAL